MAEIAPYTLLTDLAAKSDSIPVELPVADASQTHWTGLGFSLLGFRFTTPMDEVAEVMRLPPMTRLPGVKPFVQGVANVRGRLMAVLDLALFFGQHSEVARSQRRVLGVEQEDQFFGFIVDESFGMQHFPSDSFVSSVDEVDERFKPHVHGCYRVAGTLWPILSLASLADDPGLEKLASQTH